MALVVAGCSEQTSAPPVPAALVELTPGGQAKLVRQVDLSLQSGFGVRPMRAGTTWKNVGAIGPGRLYKPVDTVLTVDDGGYFNGTRSEADLVVDQSRIVGVYLTLEQKFVPATKPVSNCLMGISQ